MMQLLKKRRFSILYARRERRLRRMALILLFAVINQVLYPTTVLALTGGPSQPEVHGFEPAGTSNMVDLFTGDMNYNLPLLDVGGYPINLAYHAGASMDEEASWVGLGWSLNPGVLNRDMRGIPDDFNGDMIKKEFNIKPDKTTSFQASLPIQFLGNYVPKAKGKKFGARIKTKVNIGGTYNNYTGFGLNFGVGINASVEKLEQPFEGNQFDGYNALTNSLNPKSLGNAGLNIGYGPKTGLDIQPSVGLSRTLEKYGYSLTASGGYNSRQGLKDLTLSGSFTQIRKEDRGSASGSHSFDFAAKTYVPAPKMPMTNDSYNFHGTIGMEINAFHGNLQLTGSYAEQKLTQKDQSRAAFGYLNHQNAKNPYDIMDYNKERPIAYRPSQTKLPLSFGTYDLFSASGQGVSGQFRLMRNDVGVLREGKQLMTNSSLTMGGEFGVGNAAHGGFDMKQTLGQMSSGEWTGGRGAADKMNATDLDPANPAYEPAYFKNTGEAATEKATEGLRSLLNDKLPVALNVKPHKDGGYAETGLRNNNQTTFSTDVKRNVRQKRNQILSYLPAKEAAQVGLDKQIKSYPINKLTFGNNQADIVTIPRTSHPAHHISEATVTQTDGSRYVYGIPAYNNYQKEATFAITKPSPMPDNGLVTYQSSRVTPKPDNSTSNEKGRDNFYDAQILPAYAHSYLLTSVLSPDYVDVGNDGISDDDIGTAVKLNYSRIHDNYQWRTPYSFEKGRYQEGLKSDWLDDKAHYVYGKKEIWHVHSIETKTMVAQFYVGNRADALGVAGENGGQGTQALKRLDKIELYSKADLLKDPATSVPVKTVHFEYDPLYSLCKGVENSTGGGKLTLKKVWFTYGNNSNGALNSYKFKYNNEGTPDMYSLENYDRWGHYKPKSRNPNGLSNTEFPYVIQNEATAQLAADAWNLKEVQLPSGGRIKVDYEPDDYAYIQDKRAGQMFMINGFTNLPNGTNTNRLYESVFVNSSGVNLYKPNLYLSVTVPATTTVTDFQRLYLADVKKLYFDALVTLRDFGGGDKRKERVNGYVNIDQTKPVSISGGQAFIPILGVDDRNPIFKIALQKLRLELPGVLSPGQDMVGERGNSSLRAYLNQLFGIFPETYKTLIGLDKYAIGALFCQEVDVQKSWVRLSNPTFKKFGGGSRVKKVQINNYWTELRNNDDPNENEYGQIYKYTTQKKGISSGVAAYEPMVGNDENPFRQNAPYEQKIAFAPNNWYYIEEPIGESLFPAPTVGYSEVTVENIKYAGISLTRTGTGSTHHEFYTAKDYPAEVRCIDKQAATYKPNLKQSLMQLFKFDTRDMVAASQGYTVEVNDMHGKSKKETVLNAFGAEVSWTEYQYRNDGIGHLNNDGIPLVSPDRNVETGTIGMDMDVWHEMQQDESASDGIGMSANGEFFMVGPAPIFLPPVWPMGQRQIKQYRGTVTTKFIKRFAILERVTKMENSATVQTENQLWDAETGQTVLTRTQNEFKDNLYQLSIPAHWVYSGMGMAYKNMGLVLPNVTLSTNSVEPATMASYLVAGDEVLLTSPNTPIQHGDVLVNAAGQKMVLDVSGAPIQGTFDVKVIRSGRRNQHNAPVGSIVSRTNPVHGNQLNINQLADVLNAQATVFKEDWAVRSAVKENCVTLTPNLNATAFSNFLLDLIQAKANSSVFLNRTLAQVAQTENVMGVANNTVFFNELTPNPTIGTNQSPFIWFQTYRAQMGNDCILEIKNAGNTTAFALCEFDRGASSVTRIGNTNQWLIHRYKPTCAADQPDLIATLTCKTCTKTCAEVLAVNSQVNPYRIGAKGNWRPAEAYALYTKRTPDLNANRNALRKQGAIAGFQNFWLWDNGRWNPNLTSPKWVKTNTILHYDQKGNEVETRDALNVHSSALYRYKNTLAAAVTANARMRETAFDGFEDYHFLDPADKCYAEHWNFAKNQVSKISADKAHTGNYALKVAPNETFAKSVPIDAQAIQLQDAETNVTEGNLLKRPFPAFGIKEGRYLISAWVSKAGDCKPNDLSPIILKVNGNAYTFQPKGAIVEGWQRVEGVFPVEATATQFTVEVYNGANEAAYVDDIRILPFNAKMKSFVYDARTLRLMAQLDENNYATFYEYDDEGSLIRTKRETERGIVTLQENRNFLRPSN